MTRREVVIAGAAMMTAWRPLAATRRAPISALQAAPRLPDQEFWKLVGELSEANHDLRPDNLVSNEWRFQQVIPELTRKGRQGGAFLGLGPEQNFTYIAALEPVIAFIIDVRRANLALHLLYKALFELASDRVEFVSLLFSRPRPFRLSAGASARDIFAAYSAFFPSQRLHDRTSAAIRNLLVTNHGFAVSNEDLRAIREAHQFFQTFGPGIRYPGIGLGGGSNHPSYWELMTAADPEGQPRAFLANEQAFSRIKDLQQRNLVVPVVGNFAGPKAIRAVAAYLRARSLTVSAFYVSNVEEYLGREKAWRDFCGNVAALPLQDTSVFIRSVRSASRGSGSGHWPEVRQMMQMSNCR